MVIYTVYFSPAAKQKEELAKSNKDRDNIAKLIEKDERFTKVRLHRSSNWTRPLIIIGTVEEKEDLESLEQIVSTVKLESKIDIRIKIRKKTNQKTD